MPLSKVETQQLTLESRPPSNFNPQMGENPGLMFKHKTP